MPRGSSGKRERQYEHIESSAKERGASSGRAKEIAARTVNKQRAQSGETSGSSGSKTKSDNSKRSTSSAGRSGGSRSSGTSGSSGSSRSSGSSANTTFRQLYAEAQRRDIKGRSSMDKAQLERALAGSGGKRSR